MSTYGPALALQVTLYKYVFPPQNKHPTLCVIGLIQPWGAIMPISELQCRWAARVFSGKVRPWRWCATGGTHDRSLNMLPSYRDVCVAGTQAKLPSANAMLKDINEKKAEMKKRYKASERHTIQVDYISYSDEIADLINCKPRFWNLFFRDPEVRETLGPITLCVK